MRPAVQQQRKPLRVINKKLLKLNDLARFMPRREASMMCFKKKKKKLTIHPTAMHYQAAHMLTTK